MSKAKQILAKCVGPFCTDFNTRKNYGVILRKLTEKKMFSLKSMTKLEDLMVYQHVLVPERLERGGPSTVDCWNWFGMSLCYFASNFCSPLHVCQQLCSHKVQNMVHNTLLLSVVRMRKCCRGTMIKLRAEVFSQEMKEYPALVLPNVHKRTSAPDCPSLVSIGLYTTSRWVPQRC